MPIDRRTALRSLGLCLGGGLLVGVLTSVGQSLLPPDLASLTNSSGSWSLAAFLLALSNRDARLGLVLGPVALIGMLAGYEVATVLRGFGVGLSGAAFWVAAAIVVGPVLGAGAAWARSADPIRVGAGAGPIAGILIGEGLYGLRDLAGSTSPVYWSVQAVAGLAIIGVVGLRTRSPRAVMTAAAIAAVVASAFLVVYGADLLSRLPL